MKRQISSIILPTVWTLGTETETVADALEHTSIEFLVSNLTDKTIHITAIEAVAAGIPGNLWAWVELSPYPTTTTPNYWAAIGGGGGFVVPSAPVVIVGTGVNLAVHGFFLPWVAHSEYARLVIQTPVPAAAAGWVLQAQISAK